MPQKCSYKGLSRAILIGYYDDVSVFWWKKLGIYEKKYQSCIKIDKIRHFL